MRAFALAAAASLGMAGQAEAAIVTYTATAVNVSAVSEPWYYDENGEIGYKIGEAPLTKPIVISLGVDQSKIVPEKTYSVDDENIEDVIVSLNGGEVYPRVVFLWGGLQFDSELNISAWDFHYFDLNYYTDESMGLPEIAMRSYVGEARSHAFFDQYGSGEEYFSELYPMAYYSEVISYDFDYKSQDGLIWQKSIPSPVPLPAAAPLLLAGTASLWAIARRRQRVTQSFLLPESSPLRDREAVS
ncbi:hypothetical protein [Haematobacter genomosp. 1]|uniref:hypothetical protein n=1 Tax=Haematobacter genomosp. 1 TaxID=366618 RepID=UPI00117AFBB9|nr:hypothetical protein [Haematobacter genomosp. 1]